MKKITLILFLTCIFLNAISQNTKVDSLTKNKIDDTIPWKKYSNTNSISRYNPFIDDTKVLNRMGFIIMPNFLYDSLKSANNNLFFIKSNLEKYQTEYNTGVKFLISGAIISTFSFASIPSKHMKSIESCNKDLKYIGIGSCGISILGIIMMIDSHKFINQCRVKLEGDRIVYEF